MTVHIIGFSHVEEPLPHELLFCGTFFLFLVIPIMGIVEKVLNHPNMMIIEVFITGLGFVLYLIVSFLAMFNAEHDHHLQYLTDKEEAQHFFFKMSRIQSILSLVGTYQFLMHFIICMDLFVIKNPLDAHKPSKQIEVNIWNPLAFAMSDGRAATSTLELEITCPNWCQRPCFTKLE